MTDGRQGYRQILRATALIGSASLLTVALGIGRMKFFAVFLGPAGVGLSGLYTNLIMTAATLLGLGISSSAVREIAAAGDDLLKAARVRKVIAALAFVIAPLAAVLVWSLRTPIAGIVLHLPGKATEVGWLGIGVAATILNTIGIAVLQGMRLTGQFARAGLIGTALGSVTAVLTIWLLGPQGIFLSVLQIPIALSLVAWLYLRRTPAAPVRLSPSDVSAHAWPILRLGLAFMVSSILQSVAFLIIRTTLSDRLGLAGAGYFQAVTLISSTYVGFVLQSMGGDYYPRLTAAIADPPRAREMINHQAQVALALALPLIVAAMGFAPLILNVFYSAKFEPAAEVLKWQVFGDVFKIMAWPLAFVMLSRGAALVFFATEFLWNASYVVMVTAGIGSYGLPIVGTAYLASYAVYLAVVFVVVRRLVNFRLARKTALMWGIGVGLCTATLAATYLAQPFGYVLTACATLVAAGTSLYFLGTADAALGRFAPVVARLRALAKRPRR